MKGYRFGTPLGTYITLGLVTLIVISSPAAILVSPTLVAASPPQSTDPISFSVPSTIVQDGKEREFTTQAALSSLTARPTNNIVNTNLFYDVVFLTSTAGAIKTVQVTFPVGTAIPSGPSLMKQRNVYLEAIVPWHRK